MARSSWSAAIVFAGFPISVKAYNLLKSKSSDSFKTLCDCHKQPIKAPKTCATDGSEVPAERQLKGVEVGKDRFVVVDTSLIESAAQKSAFIEPAYFAPVDTVDAHVATGVMRLVPAEAAHAKSVAILWATLRKRGLALIADDFTARAGSQDQLLAIRAEDGDLIALTLPFTTQLSDAPKFDAPVDQVADAELGMFSQAIDSLYTCKSFDRTAHASRFNGRRMQAIEAATKGETITASAAPAAAPAVPDLMAALQASLNAVKSAPSITTNTKEPVPA